MKCKCGRIINEEKNICQCGHDVKDIKDKIGNFPESSMRFNWFKPVEKLNEKTNEQDLISTYLEDLNNNNSFIKNEKKEPEPFFNENIDYKNLFKDL